jgi:hypothetical protein
MFVLGALCGTVMSPMLASMGVDVAQVARLVMPVSSEPVVLEPGLADSGSANICEPDVVSSTSLAVRPPSEPAPIEDSNAGRGAHSETVNASAPEAMIDVRRPTGARVLIDGQPVSKHVPIVGFRVTPGTHRITVIKGAAKRTYSVHVESGEHADASLPAHER